MWKFYVIGCVFLAVNSFKKVDGTLERCGRKIQQNRKIETFVEIVGTNGYNGEEHFVTTEDGYVLSLTRMFGGPKSPPAPKKPPVLLTHGMVGSSDVWVMRGPGRDLAYLLADEGYDVWAINVRGNTYSRRHIRISPSRPEFWRFSWHEHGVYDTPAAIDYILGRTGVSKLTLIGHSMGATVNYVLLSMRPEYNKKVHLSVSLAPVGVFTRQFRGPLTLSVQFGRKVLDSLRRNGVYEVLAHRDFIPQFLKGFCSRPGARPLCMLVTSFIAGSVDLEQLDDPVVSKLLSNYPAGVSVDTLDHYRQCIVNARFREFDFGVRGNYARYGSAFPPEYPLWKITAPHVLYSALSDPFNLPADVRVLEQSLPNVLASKVIPSKTFNHLDFVISKHARELLYDDIIKDLKIYKNKGSIEFS